MGSILFVNFEVLNRLIETTLLQLFRINDPYRILLVFLILVIIRVVWITVGLPLSVPELKYLLIGERLGDGFTMYKELYDHTGPLSALVYKTIDLIFGRSRWVHLALSTLLVLAQAGIFNRILIKVKAFDENTYYPALFYAICMSSVMDFFALSPQLMSLTFVLTSLGQIFRRIGNDVTDKLFVTSGIYVGLAAGFYLPAIVFFPIFLLSFLLFSSAIARRLGLFIYGVLIVFLIVLGYFIWRRAGQEFILDFFTIGISKPKIYYVSFFEYLQISTGLLISWLIALTVIFTERVTNYQQKIQQVMIFFLVAGVLIVFVTRDLMPSDMVYLAPTISFFMVLYFLKLKKRIWRFLMPIVIIVGLVAYPMIWIKFNPDSAILVKPPRIDVPDKAKVMGIGLPINEYQNVQFTGPFLDDYITHIKLKDLDYYDASPRMADAIIGSDADVIIDKLEIAPKMFRRFPDIGNQYRQISEDKYIKINN
ncbi:MAG: hypothetical protein JXR10_12600 [Cyclobacteriaceae bacterium]